LCEQNKQYKKCGIIFNDLTPDNVIQKSLFDEVFETQSVPNNPVKNWHMRQEFLTQKYTTSWDDLPEVFS
jgi:adenylate kinase family enzyme